MRLTHASVFSGIGGPEIAATMLGWDNAFHCEINEFGRKILEYWYPNSRSYEDITKTDFSEWRGMVDVLTGGFPCQPFSYAGQRRGAEDDRYLWPSMYRAIDEIQPTWVVAENVAGILTMVEQGEVSKVASPASLFAEINDVRGQYQLRETFTLQRICTDLEGHGYAVQPILIPACAVGAPHRRDRVFIVARRNSTDTISEDTMHGGFVHGQHEVEGHQRNEWDIGAGGGERICSGTSRADSPDTSCECSGGNARWFTFPTVSPVHRGNDGLPFDVDDLAIPASKWRTESLKAYGNAIVPQVMYEIFRAIEIVERENL